MSRREENKIKRRAGILKASRKLFREKGYEKTTINEIIQVAGISRGTFYNYFADKESLLTGIAWEEIENCKACINAHNDSADDSISTDADDSISTDVDDGECEEESWEETLQRAMTFLILEMRPNLELCKKILFLVSDSENPLHSAKEELMAVMRGILNRGKDSFREDVSMEGALHTLMGLYYVGVFLWGTEEEETIVKNVAMSLDVFSRGIKK